MNDQVPVVLQNLPAHVRGFVCLGSDYEPVIILNQNLSYEQQRKTYLHEMNHIRKCEMDDESFVEYIV